MKRLKNKPNHKLLKKKNYYSGVALMALICASSTSQAMNSDDKEERRTVTNKHQIIAQSLELSTTQLLHYARWLPLPGTNIVADANGVRQIIIQKEETQTQGNVEIKENRYIAVRLNSEERDGGWVHNDKDCQSQKRYNVFVKKVFPNESIEEMQLEKEYRLGDLVPYKLKKNCLLPILHPIKENGRPTRQSFKRERTYERADGSLCIKTVPEFIDLPLKLEHKKFRHDINSKKSYQIVNCFGIEPNGERHDGPQELELENLFFAHKQQLDKGNDDKNRKVKIYFDPQEAIELSSINIDKETTIATIKCQHTGWKHDNVKLKSYKIFTSVDDNMEMEPTEEVPYKLFKQELQPVGTPNIANKQQTCTIMERYIRPDSSGYGHVLPEHKVVPLFFTHLKFCHNQDIKSSYQIIKIEGEHDKILYPLYPEYPINSVNYEHIERNHTWEDNKKKHESIQYAEIYIDTSKALESDSIPFVQKWVVSKKEIKTEKHILLAMVTTWLPGVNWKIPHSEEEYR